MVKTLREWEKALSQAVDTDYSYGLARRMEGYKSNAALGYRTAGSRAEWETGEMILREMRNMYFSLCGMYRGLPGLHIYFLVEFL